MKKIEKGSTEIYVAETNEYDEYLTDSDREMDARARQAVKAAIEKAEFCKKPVAKYDVITRRSYIEYPTGEKLYVN